MGILVLNDLTEAVPGSGTVRLGMNFGNLQEILDGDTVASCAIDVVPTDLTVVPSSTEITSGYLVSALFTGGSTQSYNVTFTPTLASGQVLPPRVGTLKLQ